MRFYRGPATVTLDGEIKVAIQCELFALQEQVKIGPNEYLPGRKSWDGSFWDAEPAHELTRNYSHATITLEGGGIGDVVITRVSIGTHSSGNGSLVGSGGQPEVLKAA